MSYVARIRKVASQMASEADNRATALKRQLAELEVQIVQVETQLNAANLAYERLTRFEPELAGSLQCPPLLDRSRNAVGHGRHSRRQSKQR